MSIRVTLRLSKKPKFSTNYVDADDPFQDEGPFERYGTIQSENTAGQITVHATAHIAVQFRTHKFSLFIYPTYARLLRWDRAGIVTKQISIAESEPDLAELEVQSCHSRCLRSSVERVLDPGKVETVLKTLQFRDEGHK